MSFETKTRGAYALQRLYSKEINRDVKRYEIFEDIKNEDSKAIEVFENYINCNCIGIERMCKKLNIKTVCIGGGLSEYSEFYFERMKEKMPKINLLVSKYKNDAGMIGASVLPIKNEKF